MRFFRYSVSAGGFLFAMVILGPYLWEISPWLEVLLALLLLVIVTLLEVRARDRNLDEQVGKYRWIRDDSGRDREKPPDVPRT